MPKVSIIVPIYNGEKFLAEALESLRKQTFKDFEVIIVDDGSTDKSFEIALDFLAKDERFQVFHRPTNRGASRAINYGLFRAQGEYIAILAADDYYLDEFLEKSLKCLEQNPDAAGVYTDFIEYYEEKGIKVARCLSDFCAHCLVEKDVINFSATIFRYRPWFNPDWEPVADWDCLLYIMSEGNYFVHLSEILSVYRIHPSQVSVRQRFKMLFKALLVPYRYTLFRQATRAAVKRLMGFGWYLCHSRRATFK